MMFRAVLPLLLLSTFAAAQTSTTTALTSTPATVAQGQAETTTVKVSASSGTPAGTVSLYGDGQLLESKSLSSGSAVFSTNTSGVSPGSYQVQAKYSGGSGFSASASNTVTVSVTAPLATVTALYISPTDIQLGGVAVLTARVGYTTGGAPAGTVAFYSGSQQLGTANLVNGVAQLTESSASVPLGTYPVYAKYQGENGNAASTSSNVSVSVTPAVDILTHRYNVQRTGVQSYETTLTPANVNSTSFGKLATYAVDGYLYAQPLYISNYTMSDGKSHNVVFAATVNGTVYAFDAGGNNPAAGYLWKASVVPAGETPQSTSDYGCGNPSPYSGVLGTPVIDRNTGAIYMVAATTSVSGSTTSYYQRLHALRLSDGTEILNGPTVIQASVPGTGAGAASGTVSFNALREGERAALMETAGQIWITWASHCDIGPYHGWTMAYNAGDVSKQTVVYNNTPNGADGGIWMTAGGLSSDNAGNVYSVAGNGTFDANTGGLDYADAASRLSYTPGFQATAASLTLGDWFVPDNQAYLSENDLDMGTADPMLMEDTSGVAPHLLVTADKTGRIYLLNREDLGKYDTGSNGPGGLNGDVQEFPAGGDIFTSFAYFNHTLYVGADNSPLVAYTFTPGTSTTAGSFTTTPASETTHSFGGGSAGGLQPVISANGASNAILWGMDNTGSNAVLYAYNPANLATMYYSSATAANNRDQGPPSVKFTLPVVAGGKVFVGGQGQLAVYGLLP